MAAAAKVIVEEQTAAAVRRGCPSGRRGRDGGFEEDARTGMIVVTVREK